MTSIDRSVGRLFCCCCCASDCCQQQLQLQQQANKQTRTPTLHDPLRDRTLNRLRLVHGAPVAAALGIEIIPDQHAAALGRNRDPLQLREAGRAAVLGRRQVRQHRDVALGVPTTYTPSDMSGDIGSPASCRGVTCLGTCLSATWRTVGMLRIAGELGRGVVCLCSSNRQQDSRFRMLIAAQHNTAGRR